MPDQEINNPLKIIFLYFPCEAENQLIRKVTAEEYETYNITESISPYIPYLKKNPGVILLADGTHPPRDVKWEDQFGYIRDNLYDAGIKIATWINSGNGYQPVQDLSNIEIPEDTADQDIECDGFTECILKLLAGLNARGRRTHVRQINIDKNSAAFSIKINKHIYTGTILDISSIAFACVFSEPTIFPPNTHIEDIQLRLNGQIISASGFILMRREVSGKSVYIISIDRSNNPGISEYIIEYIYRSNQKIFKTFSDIKSK